MGEFYGWFRVSRGRMCTMHAHYPMGIGSNHTGIEHIMSSKSGQFKQINRQENK